MDGNIPTGYPGYAVISRPQKNSWTALSYSSVLPGLGQVYNGQTAKGFAIFILTVAGLVAFLLPGIIVWLYGVYDAYTVAGKMNTGEIPFLETRTLSMILFIVFAVAVIAIAVLIILSIVMSSLMTEFPALSAGSGTDSLNKILGNKELLPGY